MPKITKKAVDALSAGVRDHFIWDSEVRGFGVRVTPKGVKSFVLQYRPAPGGRGTPARRFTIGVHGSPWAAEDARDEAKRLLAGIKDGLDPIAVRQSARDAPTVNQLCDEYLAEGCKHKKPSTLKTDKGRIARHIKPLLGKKRVKDLQSWDVQRFHDDVAAGKTKADVKTGKYGRAIVTGGAGAAARTTGLLGGILSFAVKRRYITESPAKGIERAPDNKSEKFLTGAEFTALGTALDEAERDWKAYETAHAAWIETGEVGKAPAMPRNAASPTAVAAVRLLILTGCRKSEILTLQWAHVDINRGFLHLPESKSKTGARDVPLGAPALEVLRELSRVKDNPYVLPGKKRGHHFVGLPQAWARICERAGIGKVRLHDLRHSFASVAAASGDSLLMIGKLLGHKHATTTARYAHLGADPVQQAAERVSGQIGALLTAKPSAEVIPLDSRKRSA